MLPPSGGLELTFSFLKIEAAGYSETPVNLLD